MKKWKLAYSVLFFGVCFPPDALIICLLFLVGILPIPARFP